MSYISFVSIVCYIYTEKKMSKNIFGRNIFISNWNKYLFKYGWNKILFLANNSSIFFGN